MSRLIIALLFMMPVFAGNGAAPSIAAGTDDPSLSQVVFYVK